MFPTSIVGAFLTPPVSTNEWVKVMHYPVIQMHSTPCNHNTQYEPLVTEIDFDGFPMLQYNKAQYL